LYYIILIFNFHKIRHFSSGVSVETDIDLNTYISGYLNSSAIARYLPPPDIRLPKDGTLKNPLPKEVNFLTKYMVSCLPFNDT